MTLPCASYTSKSYEKCFESESTALNYNLNKFLLSMVLKRRSLFRSILFCSVLFRSIYFSYFVLLILLWEAESIEWRTDRIGMARQYLRTKVWNIQINIKRMESVKKYHRSRQCTHELMDTVGWIKWKFANDCVLNDEWSLLRDTSWSY